MNEQIHIGIAEDHDLVREGLVMLLKDQEGIKVLFDVSNGQELLEKVKLTKPHIILLDLEMPIMSGREALEKIKQRFPKIKVIIVSAFFQDSFIIEYVKRGVHGFLPKNCKIDKVIDTIHKVHEQGKYFDSRVSMIIANELAEPKALNETSEGNENDLNDKERTIIKLICQHKTSEEIAVILNLGKKTIDYHRAKIMRKTNSSNVTALITYAVQQKIITIQ